MVCAPISSYDAIGRTIQPPRTSTTPFQSIDATRFAAAVRCGGLEVDSNAQISQRNMCDDLTLAAEALNGVALTRHDELPL